MEPNKITINLDELSTTKATLGIAIGLHRMQHILDI